MMFPGADISLSQGLLSWDMGVAGMYWLRSSMEYRVRWLGNRCKHQWESKQILSERIITLDSFSNGNDKP